MGARAQRGERLLSRARRNRRCHQSRGMVQYSRSRSIERRTSFHRWTNEGGEDIIAFVQLSTRASVSDTELAEHAAKNLAPYKRPSQILVVRELPLTPTGKV